MVKGWLANRLSELSDLLKMIYFKYPFQSVKMQAVWLLIYSFVYPFLRIILEGEKSRKICHSFLKTLFSSTLVLPLSPLLKSKVILRNFLDFEIYREIYVWDDYIHKTLKEGMNVVDIGAHIGMYAILASERIGNMGRVIAVEPESDNYKQLLKNIKINNFKNIIPQNIALSDHEGFEKFYISPDSGSHSLLPEQTEDKISSIRIPVKTVDKLLENLNFNRVDVIKIDAEGAETLILKGAEKTLQANPNVKVIVASYHYPSEIEEVCQFLNEKNFKTQISSGSIIMTV